MHEQNKNHANFCGDRCCDRRLSRRTMITTISTGNDNIKNLEITISKNHGIRNDDSGVRGRETVMIISFSDRV